MKKIRRLVAMNEDITALIKFKVEKFKAKTTEEIERKGLKPYAVVESTPEAIDLDVLLHEGILNMLYHIAGIGSAGAKWDNSNARIGVGNDATAPADTQTGLIGASQLYKGMNATYPQLSGDHDLVVQSDFVDGEAEWNWLEECIDNGATDQDDLCRQNTSLGTKPAGQTWRITGTVTIT